MAAVNTVLRFFLLLAVVRISATQAPNALTKIMKKLNNVIDHEDSRFSKCCVAQEMPEVCQSLCTYHFEKFDATQLYRTVNPGIFIVHYFLPGKCYFSDLSYFVPCAIKMRDLSNGSYSAMWSQLEHLENVSKNNKIAEIKSFMPTPEQFEEEPEWCRDAFLHGTPTGIYVNVLISCESTIRGALALYMMGALDDELHFANLLTLIETFKKFEDKSWDEMNMNEKIKLMEFFLQNPETLKSYKESDFTAFLSPTMKRNIYNIANRLPYSHAILANIDYLFDQTDTIDNYEVPSREDIVSALILSSKNFD